jgi:uncharacterized repeat protein (TIGR01451 family)
VRVKNTGTVTATSVAVTDTLPAQMIVTAGGISGGGSQVSSVITFPLIATLAAGDSVVYTITATIDSSSIDSSIATNKARFAANGVVKLDSASLRVVNRPQMSMTKVVDKPLANPGDTVTYTINYRNIGTIRAMQVIVTDPAPGNTSYIPQSIVLNGVSKTDQADGDEVTVAAGTITINIGQVQPGQSGTIRFRARVR